MPCALHYHTSRCLSLSFLAGFADPALRAPRRERTLDWHYVADGALRKSSQCALIDVPFLSQPGKSCSLHIVARDLGGNRRW